MADSDASPHTAAFWIQADALLRKNLTYQKRNISANCRLISFPFVLCILLIITQTLVDNQISKDSNVCGCQCIDTNGDGTCDQRVCGLQYSDLDQAPSCSVPSPPKWPPLLQVPGPQYRAVRSASNPLSDLPDESCRLDGSCPVSLLITGTNMTLGQSLAEMMFAAPSILNSTNSVLGSNSEPKQDNFLDPAFAEGSLYNIQSQCTPTSTFNVSVPLVGASPFQNVTTCVQSQSLWRNSSSEINDQIYQGYEKGNAERKYNEILGAYDFLNSDANNFNVNVWYNATYKDSDDGETYLVRLPRAVNLVSNAYLQSFRGSGFRMILEFVKEMPKTSTKLKLDIASLLGTLFFTWVVIQLFPVVLTALVYEKQQKLRIMMKMHGLGDGPYWMISYMYFLAISALYMFVFVAFGSIVGLKFFTLNDYFIQFVFYFLYINLQISLAFLVSAFFSNVKTATVVGYICVFGTGLLGGFLFQSFVEDASFPKGWIIFMELYPGFALYRGLYEFAEYSLQGNSMGTDGMKWGNLSDSENGMSDVMIIMLLEWLAVLCIAYYVDQIFSSGSGKNPKYLLQKFRKKRPSSFRKPSLGRQASKVFVDMDKPDVIQEREKVEQLLLEPTTTHSIVCDNLRKVYPGRDGNPEKLAVRGLSLAIPRGECFGMLGPNGAGKTSFISMMIGLTTPSSGTAYVEGLDIRTQMDWVYTSMGVCPQHDLLWETLTGREHLLFYGRLKNLKGAALKKAVEDSLKSVNLFNGGVADKQAGKYSGGMKRRLSVAISLIGDPKVVYMDEPSTGLDPASRSNLWNVVKRAKQDRAIILTTHSMEEAEYLCDRLGIFVSGGLQCVGNPKELKARYGGSYVFTMTTSINDEHEVERMVRRLSPNAERTYHMAGTQKFEMPKHEVSMADVFHAVEVAKSRFPVYAWGLSDTTLEDVFIKVANSAQEFHTLT
ncbi:PREDICTED: ABC transporter A family member 7-like [Populus euphratica]|uniref:ABC transporter A family member 7-like n=1 Tax=Populus euphratica TaxID=75702 RepID=A0AAJ6Y6B1_POPEU|nr:PREDICTED: ABC transporter A family member 7-like [Populus euphratica]